MESWTGYHFSIEDNINAKILVFQISKIRTEYFYQELESKKDELSKHKASYTFFIDFPNKHDFLILLKFYNQKILATIISINGTKIHSTNLAYTIPINKISYLHNEEIYVDYIYDKKADTNFKLLNIKNYEEIYPKLFFKNDLLISKIHLLINSEYLVLSLKKLDNIDILAVTLFIINIDSTGKINFSQSYNFFIKDFDKSF